MIHEAVLLKEVLGHLSPQANQNFIDATFGAGGHSSAILQKTFPQGKVMAFDTNADIRLETELEHWQQQGRLTLVRRNFSELSRTVEENRFSQVSGVLFDLGLSSDMLDDPKRGFSFQVAGPLDMRFDQSQALTAEEILNTETEARLQKIFSEFGEEKFSGRIAKAIARTRRANKFKTTFDLFNIIKSSLPAPVRHRAADSARRIFQALRIAVNRELENLKLALPQALEVLKPGGRLAVISFHSLEDRIVKRFFLEQWRGCVCPPEFPECVCGRNSALKILTKKPVTASADEIELNGRAKPAKLRVAQKL